MDNTDRFWTSKPLTELSESEWESLCDGCGKCCLHKLQDEETDDLLFTTICCEYLDTQACACTVYESRTSHVPDCLNLNAEMLKDVSEWLPPTCAYRILFEGGELPSWHHLVSGDTQVIHLQHMSVKDKVISETLVDESDWHEYLIH